MPAGLSRPAMAAVAGLTAAPVAVLAVTVRLSPSVRSFDASGSAALRTFGQHHPGWTRAAWWVTELGGTLAAVAVLAILAVALLVIPARMAPVPRWSPVHRRLVAGYALVAVLVPGGLVEAVKQVVRRSRPEPVSPSFHFTGFSFPSGHSAHIAAEAFAVSLLLLRLTRSNDTTGGRRRPVCGLGVAVASLVVVAVGWSRVALGAHYPTDVLAGWALGASWVAAVTAAYPPVTWLTRRPDPRTGHPPG